MTTAAGGLRRMAQRACDRMVRRVVAGQPVHDTHPHLLAEGELLPGITRAEFAQRRTALAESLPRNSVALLPGAQPQYVTGVIPHSYRQVRVMNNGVGMHTWLVKHTWLVVCTWYSTCLGGLLYMLMHGSKQCA